MITIAAFSNNPLKSKSNFTEIYDSLKVKLKVIKIKYYVFSFDKMFDGDIWNWYKSDNLYKVDSSFYTEYLCNEKELTIWKDYQTLYFTYIVDFNDEFKHLVISQFIHNGNESNMYLVNFSDKGKILGVFLLAKIEKSPDDLLKLSSELINLNLIKTTKIFMVADKNEIFKDSIIISFRRNNNEFIKTKIDSIRFTF